MMTRRQFCVLCFLGGVGVPWALLALGGIVGALPSMGVAVDKSSAYLMALGLAILTIGYLLQRLAPRS